MWGIGQVSVGLVLASLLVVSSVHNAASALSLEEPPLSLWRVLAETKTPKPKTTKPSASSSNSTIIPDASWTCGMASGIPDPTRGQLVFRATLQLSGVHNAGKTQYGQRRILDVKGGTISGSRIKADVLPGGFDFELTLSNGVVEVEQINMLRASDGSSIYLRACGVALDGAKQVRIVPDFEVATSSSLAWLNTGKFVGTRTVDTAANTIQIDVYDVASIGSDSTSVQVNKPKDVPSQPWECSTTTGQRGNSVFTETVTLGNSISVGSSKRGNRNVIPITGGTVSGRFVGTILSGGADYQLYGSGGGVKLDARYVLVSSSGEYVMVRNCGAFGALIPQFEARADGPYAFFNSGKFLSSDPGSASGGVSITVYERK